MARWFNEPPVWALDGTTLTVRTAPDTDFWNGTFYGFVHDNGHFHAHEAKGDFSAGVTFKADYQALYDQAGLMLRVDDRNWLKAGIEFTDDALHFSVVVTRDGQSDWSMTPLPAAAAQGLDLRITRHAEAIRVQFRLPGDAWRMARLAFLGMPESVDIGPMCCAPTGPGVSVQFDGFAVGAPIARALHEDGEGDHK